MSNRAFDAGTVPQLARCSSSPSNCSGMPVPTMRKSPRFECTVADIVNFVGGYTEKVHHLVIGGPMTGRSVTTDKVPLVKATNCILVLSDEEQFGNEQPCIRCGDCASACPVQLQPQQLFWYACADNEEKLRRPRRLPGHTGGSRDSRTAHIVFAAAAC